MKPGARFLRDEPDKYIAIRTGHILRGLTISQQNEMWRMIIKVDDKRGNHLVAFVVMPTIYDCWEYLYEHYTTTAAPLRWSTDRYYRE